MTARSPQAAALEHLRLALDAAHSALIACKTAKVDGDLTTTEAYLQDSIAECAWMINQQSERDDEHDPEVIADREADERHERGLRNWHYGRTL
jgi:hypothetical protein